MQSESKENLIVYGGASVSILIMFGIGFILYKFNIALVVLLTLAPLITGLMKFWLHNRISDERAQNISYISLGILLVSMVCLIGTYDKCRNDIVELLMVNKNQWQFSFIEIYLFVIMLASPYYSFKFITEINDKITTDA